MEPRIQEIIASMDEAQLRVRRDELGADVRNISSQLADRDKRDGFGRRMDAIAWHTWRQSALVAQRHKIDELQAVKRRLHEIQQEKDAAKRSAQETNGNGHDTSPSLDWKPIVMRALDEAQRDRDRLVAIIERAGSLLAGARAGTKAAEALALLRGAVARD